jgi:hypothetical protein
MSKKGGQKRRKAIEGCFEIVCVASGTGEGRFYSVKMTLMQITVTSSGISQESFRFWDLICLEREQKRNLCRNSMYRTNVVDGMFVVRHRIRISSVVSVAVGSRSKNSEVPTARMYLDSQRRPFPQLKSL